VRCDILLIPNGWRRDQPSTFLINMFRASMTSMNNIGERGSPCRKPQAWKISVPQVSFIKTRVLAVEMRVEIQSHHKVSKPTLFKISSKKDHATESKALEMLILSRRLDRHWAWKSLAEDWMHL
jgi:hypothetical protein